MTNPHQTKNSNSILKELQSSSDVATKDEDLKGIHKFHTALDASNFLFTLQQPTTELCHPDYKRVLDELKFHQIWVQIQRLKRL